MSEEAASPAGASGTARAIPITLLVLGNLLYQAAGAVIAVLLPAIGDSFAAPASQLALVIGAGSAGLAVSAVPAGALVHRWGARRVLGTGLMLLGAGWVLGGLAPDIAVLALLRFLAGIGGSMFYVTSYGWVGEAFPPERRGVALGLVWSGGVVLGGTLGFVSGALLEPILGWRADLAWGGLVTLALVPLVLAAFPARRDRPLSDVPEATLPAVRGTLRSRSTWGLSIGVGGAAAGATAVISFAAIYVTSVHPSWGLDAAALASSVAFAGTVPGSVFGGWIGELGEDRRLPLAGLTAAFGLLELAIPRVGEAGFVALYGALGFLFGGAVALLYGIPSHLEETGGARLPITIGTIESVQLVLSASFAVVFGAVVVASGYPEAWTAAALLALALVPAVGLIPPNRGRRPVGALRA